MRMGERHRRLRRAERITLLAAAICFIWIAGVLAHRAISDRREPQRLEVAPVDDRSRPADAGLPAGPPQQGSVFAILDIPRIGFSQLVAEGDDDETLRLAVGHLPDTPLPWQGGNTALAGHRDGDFRPLRHIRTGDRILLTTKHGDFGYVIEKTIIVNPDDIWVLDPTPDRTLTLITCYPFNFIGHAPKRFVIKARAAL